MIDDFTPMTPKKQWPVVIVEKRLYEAMRRVCDLVESERRYDYPAALIDALDALAEASR